jgi:hypothetical protein
MKTYRGADVDPSSLNSVLIGNGQLHALTVLDPEKEPPVSTGQEAGLGL